jgi:hypothetical protein
MLARIDFSLSSHQRVLVTIFFLQSHQGKEALDANELQYVSRYVCMVHPTPSALRCANEQKRKKEERH